MNGSKKTLGVLLVVVLLALAGCMEIGRADN